MNDILNVIFKFSILISLPSSAVRCTNELKMAEGSNQSTTSSAPVPKPRRHVIIESSNKTSYENVSIDLINKNININDENLQNNTKSKLPNNKAFLTSGNGNGTSDEYRNVITELNDLHSDKNKNSVKLEEINKLSNIYDDDENCKKPVPAPRRAAATKAMQIVGENVYENAGERKRGDDGSCSPSTSSSTSSSIGNNEMSGDYCVMKISTGAVNKIKLPSMDAPELPEKKSSAERRKQSESSRGSYSFVDETDCAAGEGPSGRYNIKKSLSSSSLNSSQSGSSEKAGTKYSTSSPG